MIDEDQLLDSLYHRSRASVIIGEPTPLLEELLSVCRKHPNEERIVVALELSHVGWILDSAVWSASEFEPKLARGYTVAFRVEPSHFLGYRELWAEIAPQFEQILASWLFRREINAGLFAVSVFFLERVDDEGFYRHSLFVARGLDVLMQVVREFDIYACHRRMWVATVCV